MQALTESTQISATFFTSSVKSVPFPAADAVVGKGSIDHEKLPSDVCFGIGAGVGVGSSILEEADDFSAVVVTTSVANFSTVTLSVSTDFVILEGVSVGGADNGAILVVLVVLVNSSSEIRAAAVPRDVWVGSTGAILGFVASDIHFGRCQSCKRVSR